MAKRKSPLERAAERTVNGSHGAPVRQRSPESGREEPPAKTFPPPIPASQLAAGGAAANWLWRGYLARGSVTLLTSLWKSGKSTLLSHLVKTIGQGGELAGFEVTTGNVLVVSEEPEALWAGRRDNLGIGDHASFYIRPFLGRPNALDWLAFVEHVAALAKEQSLALVCLDTLSAISPCDDENDAAKMLAALSPLHRITEAGAGVLLIHHPSKGDAGEGRASRGSGALPGFVDIIVEMRRAVGSDRGNRQRVLSAYSRYDETPGELVIELAEDGSGYSSLGCRSDADRHSRWQAIAEALPGEPPGKTVEELLGRWPEEIKKPGKRTLEQDLTSGAESGHWSMGGAGKRGDPYRFWRAGNSTRAATDSLPARIESDGPYTEGF